MSDAWIVKRRPRRPSAMQRHRFIEARVAAGRSAVAFPGTPMPEPAGARERLVSSGVSILVHGGLLLLFVLLAHLAREEIVEQTIEISLPKPSNDEPAPRPRAIAESTGRFDPAPMALPPTIVNPTVIQPRIANVQAAPVQLADLQPVQAPREIAIQAPEVSQVRQLQSPIAATTAAPRVLDTSAPQLSGEVDLAAPTGTLAGPRQVTTGNTVGIAGPSALGTGSSVKDGIASNRDVLGAKTGERASVNVAVGPGGGRGTGGDGTGTGGISYEECMTLPEVKDYMARMYDRVLSRWRSLPTGLPNGNYSVTLSFKLDPSGSASEIAFKGAANDAVGRSAADAMRAASPFDQMSGRTRCLAGNSFNATFKLDTFAASN